MQKCKGQWDTPLLSPPKQSYSKARFRIGILIFVCICILIQTHSKIQMHSMFETYIYILLYDTHLHLI